MEASTSTTLAVSLNERFVCPYFYQYLVNFLQTFLDFHYFGYKNKQLAYFQATASSSSSAAAESTAERPMCNICIQDLSKKVWMLQIIKKYLKSFAPVVSNITLRAFYATFIAIITKIVSVSTFATSIRFHLVWGDGYSIGQGAAIRAFFINRY